MNQRPRIKDQRLRIKELLLFALCSLFLVLVFSRSAHGAGASLSLSPASGVYTKERTFTVALKVNTGGEPINAAEGELSFVTDDLEVVAVSKADSIFNLWTADPYFSNARGTISFGGGTTATYAGPDGTLFTITFRARDSAALKTSVIFVSGAILAADGRGSNIITRMESATYTFAPPNIIPAAEEYVAPSGAPEAPVIVSETHPDSATWYDNNNPSFSWTLPADIAAVRLLVDGKPGTLPTQVHEPAVATRQLTGIVDGTWYLHAQFKNASGWGRVSDFKFQVDREEPEYFDITFEDRADLTEPVLTLYLNAFDLTSGIDHYEIQVDNTEPMIWRDDGSKLFRTASLDPGTHTVIARAVDASGNALVHSFRFDVAPVEMPVITEFPRFITGRDPAIIGGTGIPGTTAVVSLQREGDSDVREQKIRVDGAGKFTFISDERLADGIYRAWAQTIDERGAKSELTDAVVFSVQEPLVFKMGAKAINAFSVLIPLAALIFVFAFLMWFGWHRFALFRKRLAGEIHEAERILHTYFELLRNDLREHMALLEQAGAARELTDEEKRFIDQFGKHLEEGEHMVVGEMEKAEHEK